MLVDEAVQLVHAVIHNNVEALFNRGVLGDLLCCEGLGHIDRVWWVLCKTQTGTVAWVMCVRDGFERREGERLETGLWWLSVWYGGGGAGGYLWYGVVWGKRRVGIHLLSESRRGGAGGRAGCAEVVWSARGCQRVGGRCDWLRDFGAFRTLLLSLKILPTTILYIRY